MLRLKRDEIGPNPQSHFRFLIEHDPFGKPLHTANGGSFKMTVITP
jgi:hypothetical protein